MVQHSLKVTFRIGNTTMQTAASKITLLFQFDYLCITYFYVCGILRKQIFLQTHAQFSTKIYRVEK